MTTILIAEYDLMIADFLEEMLVDAGYTVCGIATTVAQAVELSRSHRPDLAILDIRLKHGDLGTGIVPLLPKGDRIGILYATGNDDAQLTQAHGDVVLSKPYMSRDVLRALEMVQQIVAGRTISPPVPAIARVLS